MKSLKKTIKRQFGIYDKETRHIFVIIKPGFLSKSQAIINTFASHGWNVGQIKTKKLTLKEAQKLYSIHRNEDFYNDLCKYMSSDLSTGILFTGKKSMDDGIFDRVNIIKDKIRKRFGESEMRNAIHSSDSKEHMDKEASIYFTL